MLYQTSILPTLTLCFIISVDQIFIISSIFRTRRHVWQDEEKERAIFSSAQKNLDSSLKTECAQPIFHRSSSTRNQRCPPEDYLQLETRKVSTKYGKRTFEYAGPRLWNALPLNIRTEEEIEKYKSQVKTILFTDATQFKKKAFMYM